MLIEIDGTHSATLNCRNTNTIHDIGVFLVPYFDQASYTTSVFLLAMETRKPTIKMAMVPNTMVK